MSADLLLVDDDERLRRALERALSLEGFGVRGASGGREAVRAIAERRPDLILLDLGMPDVDGLTVLRHLRNEGVDAPVLILSARTEIDERVRGLEAGADDYLVKPFAIAELRARIQALLRRRAPEQQVRHRVGDLTVDPRARRAERGGRLLELTRREFDLLAALAARAGEVRSRADLLGEVWGYAEPVETNVVDVFAGYLRRKLEAGGEPRILHTVRGIGFVLEERPPA